MGKKDKIYRRIKAANRDREELKSKDTGGKFVNDRNGCGEENYSFSYEILEKIETKVYSGKKNWIEKIEKVRESQRRIVPSTMWKFITKNL